MYIIKDILSQQIVPMAIICIVLGICILPLRKNGKFSKQGLEIENMTIIKSLACIMVIVSHLCAQMEGIGILALPANVGFLAVGMFFLCSGYGLTYSYINKENYIQHFLKRRLLCILIPFWSANIIYIVLEQKELVGSNLIKSILGIDLVCGHFWYIQCIIVLYILFYICARIIKNKKVMVFGLILLSIAYDVWWQIENAVIGQSLPFVLGIVFAFSDLKWVKVKLNDFKKYILIIISFTIVFFVTFFIWSILRWHVKFPEYFISIIGIVCQNIFVLLIVLCAMGFISKSIIGKYIGKASYEIFLLHQISIDIFQNLFGDANLSVVIIGSIVSSIAMGSIFHWIMKKVIERLKRY